MSESDEILIEKMVTEIISDCATATLTGKPKRYGFDSRHPFNSLLPNGKRLGKCTGAEIGLVGKAYEKAATYFSPEAAA